ncbi:aldo/keto reductase [Nonomuraea sp. NPDC050556]|uniref:aldo/keto reductase n=1 Tax=Nonomuraea sp. NPDC050556 TaxID=3364369 RepID=UPI003789032E
MRTLGRSGIEVSEIGFGAWAIGGPFSAGGQPVGWGAVDDDESVAAIHRALDLGVTFFDTADVYGTGHSEQVLRRALDGRRDQVVIATKFGNTFDAATRELTGQDVSPAYIRSACRASLERLGTDWIDLYQLHYGAMPYERVDEVLATLEELADEGLIRSYAWSTDDPDRAAAFAKGPRCTAVQHQINVLEDTPEMLAVCATHDLASVDRGPLAMGLLSGKYTADSRLPEDDVRAEPEGRYFRGGRPAPEYLDRLAAVREVLTAGGRTLAQGALGWLLARDSRTVPIPGIRTVAQAEENAAALTLGPLTGAQLTEIRTLLGR